MWIPVIESTILNMQLYCVTGRHFKFVTGSVQI